MKAGQPLCPIWAGDRPDRQFRSRATTIGAATACVGIVNTGSKIVGDACVSVAAPAVRRR
jgi:hypothetical protein